MVGNGQVKPEQEQHAAYERLGLAQREVEHEPQGQHELNGRARVHGLPAGYAPPRCTPSRGP